MRSIEPRVAVERSVCEIPHWPELAKHLRYRPDIYARYGGEEGGGGEPGSALRRHSGARSEPGISRFRVRCFASPRN